MTTDESTKESSSTTADSLDDDVGRIVEDLQSAGLVGGDDDRPVFDAPWQARAFGLAVTLHREGRYEWPAFQQRLIEEVDAEPPDPTGDRDAATLEATYYRQWMAALERLVVEEGILSAATIEERATEFADGTRDASEFVTGEHGHGHDHEHHHDH